MRNTNLYVVEAYVKGLTMDLYVWANTPEGAISCVDKTLLETFKDPENVYTLACYPNERPGVVLKTERYSENDTDGFLRAEE